jgi:hypothetical protein
VSARVSCSPFVGRRLVFPVGREYNGGGDVLVLQSAE